MKYQRLQKPIRATLSKVALRQHLWLHCYRPLGSLLKLHTNQSFNTKEDFCHQLWNCGQRYGISWMDIFLAQRLSCYCGSGDPKFVQMYENIIPIRCQLEIKFICASQVSYSISKYINQKESKDLFPQTKLEYLLNLKKLR